MHSHDSVNCISLYLVGKSFYSLVLNCVILEREIKSDLLKIIKTEQGSAIYLSCANTKIYDVDFILEYLEGRFPYPPLYPASPILVTRARIEQMYMNHYIDLLEHNILTNESLYEFSEHNLELIHKYNFDYVLGNSFQIIDCMIASLYRICIKNKLTIKLTDPRFIKYLKLVLNNPFLKLAYELY